MKNISVLEISRSDFLKASYSLWRLLFPFPVVDDITRPHMWSYFGVNFTKVFTKLDFACIHYSPFSCFFYVLKEKYEFICWKVRPISKLRSFSARQSMHDLHRILYVCLINLQTNSVIQILREIKIQRVYSPAQYSQVL